MLADSLPDECDPTDVAALDRSELIDRVRTLEEQRSMWELRIRIAQERESMYLAFVNDMGTLLAATYQYMHDGISEQARKAEKLIEMIQEMVKKVEVL